MLSPSIRRARIDDARALSEIAEKTFRDTFGDANTLEDMALHCAASYSEKIQANEILDQAMLTLLSENQGGIVGFSQLRWGDTPDCVSARIPCEIQRLYVSANWHGKGVAHELMRTAIAAAVERQSDAIWLGVWERNRRAIAFYRKFDFVEVGEHEFRLGADPQRDVIMVRSLGSGTGHRSRKMSDLNLPGNGLTH